MGRANDLLERARGSARIWNDFILAYQKDSSQLYCFFEGKDDPRYYNLRIKSIVFQTREENFEYFWCKGKRNVIEVFDLISKDVDYQNAWVAFFIDKDFDDLPDLPHDNRVFITPCYAVENLYVSQKLVKQVCRDEFSISETDDDFPSTIDLFKNMLDTFNDVMEELNAWLCLQRHLEKATGNQSKININNLTNRRLFTINLTQITKNYTLATLAEKFPEAPPISPAQISLQIAEFRQKGRTSNFRGKYLIYFLGCFLMCLVEDRREKKTRHHFTNYGKVQLQLSANIISELSHYADTPESLWEFLIERDNAHERQLELEL